MASNDELLLTTSSSTNGDYEISNIEQSTINDSVQASTIKNAISEYCNLIVNTPIFNTNVNKDGVKQLLITFFEDLYVNEPEDVMNYIGQKPSNKLVNTIFEKFGIDEKFIKNYPDLLKTKTAYLLNNLTATKGTVNTFKYFNSILSEFYKDINFYKVIVDIKEKGNRYDYSNILYKYYSMNGELVPKYADSTSGKYPSPNTIIDNDIELKYFINYNKAKNIIEFDIRLFDPQPYDVYLKFNTMSSNEAPILIPRGQTSKIYNKLAFDTSAIKEYDKPKIISVYYNNASYYDLTTLSQLTGQKDSQINYNILVYNTSTGPINKVRYVVDFGKAHPYDIKFAIDKLSSKNSDGTWDFNYITLTEGETKYDTGDIEIQADELEYEAGDKQQARSYDDLVFRLEPILINDPNNIQTEVNSAIMLSRKFLMNKIDFFDQDVDNLYKRNVFPIYTNIIHMQLGASTTIDNTKMHPDLIRMYGMTYLHNNQVLKFIIGGNTYKLNIQEYVDVLSYLKFKQIEITTGKRYVNPKPVEYYYQYKLPKEKLQEIYDLHLFYMGMPQKYSAFKEFKERFNNLLFTKNQQVKPYITKMDDFIDYLKGNAPDTLEKLYLKIEEDFPYSTVFSEGRDQNLYFRKQVDRLRYDYNVKSVEEFFDILPTISITESLTSISVYDMIKAKYTLKYPRLVASIESLTTVDQIVEIYLFNYKIAIDYTSKMDNIVEYFMNDLYQTYIQSTAFKKRFFNPVVDLFEQYFFKAEQIYKTEDSVSEIVRDKTNVILTDDNNAIQVSKDRVYSIAFKRDWVSFLVQTKQIDTDYRLKLTDHFDIDVYDIDKKIKTQYNSARAEWVDV